MKCLLAVLLCLAIVEFLVGFGVFILQQIKELRK